MTSMTVSAFEGIAEGVDAVEKAVGGCGDALEVVEPVGGDFVGDFGVASAWSWRRLTPLVVMPELMKARRWRCRGRS